MQANDRKSKIKLRGRNALLWSLIGFAVLQLSLGVCMDRWQPELRDPEYGYKLMRLRERLHEEPNRPLMLVIGSSRAGLGFNPGEVAVTLPQSAETPAIFNFAMPYDKATTPYENDVRSLANVSDSHEPGN